MQLKSEIWKDIKGYEGKYQISNKGNIRSLPRQGVSIKNFNKKLQKDRSGYLIGQLGKPQKMYKVHRLVAEAFIPNPNNKSQVNHKNGIKNDNNMENLEWCTPSENVKHSYDIGLKNSKGEKHPRHKLAENDVSLIKFLLKFKISQQKIAILFHVSSGAITDISIGRNWGWVK